jgi:hypothetical protein
MMNGRRFIASALALALLATLALGPGQAQGPGPAPGNQPEGAAAPAYNVEDVIPIQGLLVDADGAPLPDGDYTLTYRLYGEEAVDPLCEDVDGPPLDPGYAVQVVDGQFMGYFHHCTADDINGRQLYLGIQVEDDEEMLPRQPIYPVPYAWSLRPGAVIDGWVSGDPALSVRNSATGDDSIGVYGQASAVSGETYGVVGASASADGYGGRFVGGNGLYAYGTPGVGVAIKAAGAGTIQSTANSYLWISGNSLQKGNSEDSTRFEFDSYGGYEVYGGEDWGVNKTVLLPVAIPGQLYGQDVTVTGLDLYYTNSQDDFTSIARVAMRRQDGVGSGDTIFTHDPDLYCADAQCSKHWTLTQNNVLGSQQGIVYIAMELGFAGASSYVQIGGVRLTLEHD